MALFRAVTWVCCITFLLLLLLQSSLLSVSATKKYIYIVHMNKVVMPKSYGTHEAWYTENLQTVTPSASPDSILYSYDSAINGFAAFLTKEEAETLRQSHTVSAVYEDTFYTLHTTRTPEFLGLDSVVGLWPGHIPDDLYNASQNVVIGVIDTGVWPESESFKDEGMSDIPKGWKGTCDTAHDFNPKKHCNKKLIGARAFLNAYGRLLREYNMSENLSPRDRDGHGTHTASTAAGATVKNASLYSYATGNARGMASGARLAIYRVFGKEGCLGADILAAMDQAIHDGVDVLSMSIGGPNTPYYNNTIAVGAFAAMKRGIVVSCSAGNSGPGRESVTNVAPWIMTVGAGTLDRDFPAYASIGDDRKFKGISLYSGEGMGKIPVELVYNTSGNNMSYLCMPGSLDPTAVRGKVVLCDRGINSRVEKGSVVKDAGGVGMILANTAVNGEELVADSHLLPAVAVGMKVGDLIRNHVRTHKNSTAMLSFGGTVLNVKPSPVVAAFSSRGPNNVTREVMKPDLIGPGVNILAAWPDNISPADLAIDTRTTKFNILSGTSMSCPHISGLAALVKAAHPKWSPSAIKSALMTTAYTVDNTNSPLRDAVDYSISTPYAYGAGYVDIQKALNPGLVYNITARDYISFICSLNYDLDQFKLITKRKKLTCERRFENPGQLNYPSFSVLFNKETKVVNLSRVLTNVGSAGSKYTVSIETPANVKVKVKPKKLVFKKVGERKRYKVTFKSKSTGEMDAFGSIIWKNLLYEVRSPIAVAWH